MEAPARSKEPQEVASDSLYLALALLLPISEIGVLVTGWFSERASITEHGLKPSNKPSFHLPRAQSTQVPQAGQDGVRRILSIPRRGRAHWPPGRGEAALSTARAGIEYHSDG